MNTKNKSLRIALVLAGLLAIWSIVFLYFWAAPGNSTESRSVVPENATVVVRVDGNSLMSSITKSTLLESNDDLVTEIIEWLEERKLIGVNLNAEMYGFEYMEKNKRLIGFSFSLRDPDQFRANVKDFFGSKIGFSDNGEIGVVLTSKTIKVKDLMSKAQNLISSDSSFDFDKMEMDHHLSYWSHQTEVNLKIELNEMVVDGIWAYPLQVSHIPQLRSNGLTISSTLFPFMQEDWDQFCKDIATREHELQGVSASITGFDINGLSSDLVAPKGEFVVEFGGESEPVQFLADVFKAGYVELQDNSHFKYGESIYNFKIEGKRIHVSSDQLSAIESSESVLSMQGKPSHVFNLEGSNIAQNILKMNPLFRSSKALVQEVGNLDLKVVPQKNKTMKLKGSIEFKEGSHPELLILSFLFESDVLPK